MRVGFQSNGRIGRWKLRLVPGTAEWLIVTSSAFTGETGAENPSLFTSQLLKNVDIGVRRAKLPPPEISRTYTVEQPPLQA